MRRSLLSRSRDCFVLYGFILAVTMLFIAVLGVSEPVSSQSLSGGRLEGSGSFRYAAAVDGDVAVVGAEWHDGFRGAAYVFRRRGSEWMLEKRLSPSDLGPYDHFGGSASIDGDYIIVGAAWHDSLRGAAYVFKQVDGEWIQWQKLTASDAPLDTQLGSMVRVDGETITIAAGSRHERAVGESTIYRFERSGDRWDEREILGKGEADAGMSLFEASSPDEAFLSNLLEIAGIDGSEADPPDLLAAPPEPVETVTTTNGTLEDRVEVRWSSVGLDAIVYKVLRDGELLSIAASDVTLFLDTSGSLNTTYSYCIVVKDMADQESTPVCADGRRIIFSPTSVEASDGQFVDRVAISWVDISKIEEGYYIYRDGTKIDSTQTNGFWFSDTTCLQDSVYDYEVRAFAEGEQSASVGDSGWRGQVLPPLDVTASDGQYTDRVMITWQDQTDAELGYRIYRDGVPIDSTGVDGVSHIDSTVVFGVTYEYCVATIGPGEAESIWICDEGGTLLTPPGNVSASDSTYDDRIAVTWEDLSPDEDGYEISRALGPDTTVLDTTRMNAEVYNDFTAIPDMTYTYFVRAVTDSGCFSTAGSDEGFRSIVLAPVNVQASDGTFEDHVDITWESHSKTAVLFKIYRDAQFVKSLSVGNSTYSDYGGTAGRIYEYSVVAATALEVEATGSPDEGNRELSVPTGVAASDEEYEDKIVVSWTDNSQLEHGYAVTRRDEGAAEPDTTFTTGPNWTAITDYDAIPGVTYIYSVAAYDSLSGEEGYSESAEDEGLRVLLAPTSVQASDAEFEERVEIFWNDNSNAEDGYRIYRDDEFIGETADNFTSYVDTSPELGETHTYSVAAYDSVLPSGMGESDKASDNGSTTILAPVSFNASDVYEDRVELTWVDVSSVETGFEIWRDNGPSTSPEFLATTGSNTTTYTDHPLDPNTEYRYCIKAVMSTSLISEEVCDDGLRSMYIGTEGIPLYRKLEREVPAEWDQFGNSIGVSNNTVVVGASGAWNNGETYSGAAYISERDVDGNWTETTRLTANDAAASDLFGGAVAIDGPVVIIGSSGDDGVTGAAYIFRRDDNDNWYQDNKLMASDGSSQDAFGCSVAIEADTVLIGARGHDTDRGAVYIFQREGGVWSEKDILTATQRDEDDWFGKSIAKDGEVVLIGAYGAEGLRGSVYVFQRQGGSWTEIDSITATDGSERDYFGVSVAIDGDIALIGAHGDEDWTGSVYVFQRQMDGTWLQRQKLTASDGAVGDKFGVSIALRGGVALIGAQNADEGANNSGSAYLFECDQNGNWIEKQKLVASDPGDYYHFGSSVALGNDVLMIGSLWNGTEFFKSGAVYILETSNPPVAVSASDGTYDSRIHVTWEDVSSNEDGYRIYRDGGLIEDVSANVEVFEDYDAEPGRAYSYSVASYRAEAGRSLELAQTSDFGWRPPNGNIAGRVSAIGGGASEGIFIGLDPMPTKALLLDGAGGHIRVPDSNGDFNFTIDDDFTIEAWFKFVGNGGSGSGDGALIAKVSPTGGSSDNYPFWLSNMRSEDYPGRLRFALSDGVKNVGVASIDSDLNDNTWHHVACVHDAEKDEIQIYIDGVLENITPYTGLGDISNSDSLSLGSGATAGSSFGGQLDEIRIWDVARDSTQIREVMYEQLNGEEVGLVAYWPLDEGSIGLIMDPYVSNHYGVFSGGVYWTDNCAPLDILATTDPTGAYALSDLRYGSETTFKVRPFEGKRQFEPPFTLITLSVDQPVENQVNFSDISSYTISGVIKYEGTDCPSADVPIMVDGIMKGATDKNGKFSVSVDNGSYSVEPILEGHSFEPESFTVEVDDDIELPPFADLTTRTLSGTVGGGCGRRIGDVTITIRSENNCLTRSIIADSTYSLSLPPQTYLVSAAVVESTIPEGLISSDVIRYFQNLGARQAVLDNTDVEMNMMYRAPLIVSIEGLESYIPTECNEPLKFEGRVLPDNLPVIPQLEVIDLVINVNEDYGSEGLCPLDSGIVVIYDEIFDKEGTPIELEVIDGEAGYTTFACTPSLIVGRVDAQGNDRSFQKAIRAIALVEGRTSVTGEKWVLVTGHVEEEGAEFITATTNEPIYILRDPPGDRSYSFVEESHSVRKLTYFDSWETQDQIGVRYHVELGASFTFFFGLGAGTIENIGFKTITDSEALFGALVSHVHRWDETITTKKRLATSADQMFIGEDADVFVGAGVNYIFGKTGRVEVIDCEVIRSTGIGFEPEGIETMYAYNQRYIEDALIPELQSMVEHCEEQDLGEAEKYEVMIEDWRDIIAMNDSLKLVTGENSFPILENRSFSGGAEFSFMCDSIQTTLKQQYISFVFDTDLEVLGFSIASSKSATRNLRFPVLVSHYEEVTDYYDSTVVDEKTMGFVLSDHNPGDYFTVDIRGDGMYPSPVFDVLAGASSCPYEAWPDSSGEPRVMARDKPKLYIEPPEIDGVPPDEEAVFTMNLVNLSPTEEPRRYCLREVASANPYGALIRANGVFINDDLVYYPDPGEALQITVTVERGPTHFSYDSLGIMVYPLCEWWVFEDGGPLNLADTVYFDVTFETPCSDITLFRPESGWIVSETDSFVDFELTDYELAIGEKILQAVGIEYRRLGSDGEGPTEWGIACETAPDSSMQTDCTWQPDESLLDGAYELRAYTVCAAGTTYSLVSTGTIDRHAPVVFGTPEPADEDLSFGEDITITFNETINCSSIADNLVTLTWLDGPDEGEEVALETVCDGNTIVIVPLADADLLEGRRLEASVEGIRDGVGNVMHGTVTWAFDYRKSRFAWSDGSPSVTVPFRNPGEVTAELVNGTAAPIDFTITQIPEEWIASATPGSGTIESGGSALITFDILDGIAIGTHEDEIIAEGTTDADTSQARMLLSLDVSCITPQWEVRPSDFEYSMTMVAELDIPDSGGPDTNDRVSAWVGDQLRGMAHVQEVTGLPSTHLVFLTIYGNRTQGETVRFQVWDDDDCRLYNGTLESYPFVVNDQIGSPMVPVTLTAADVPVTGDGLLAIEVDAGWTWFSTNIKSPDMSVEGVTADLTPASGDIVKSQSAFSQFVSDSTGWVPSLVLDNVSSYMIYLSQPGTILHSGTTVPVDSVIPVGQGWNWIGYLPDGPIEVTQALGDLDSKGIASTNDIIKSQDGFAQYYGSVWYGSLDSMRTGEGYKLYLAAAGSHTFNYPEYVSSPPAPIMIAASADEPEPLECAPEWSVNPRDYQYNMTVTSVLLIEGAESSDSNDIIGAFVGDECRGVTNPVYVQGLGRYIAFLMVYSNEAEGEEVTFRAFDADAALICDIEESILCTVDAVEGTVLDPLVLNAESAQDEETVLPSAFGLAQNYPNPFNPATVIHYDVPAGGGVVTLRIYDVGGRLVRVLVDGFQTAGRKSVTWYGKDDRGNDAAVGVYFYRMTAPGFERTRKMVLLK